MAVSQSAEMRSEFIPGTHCFILVCADVDITETIIVYCSSLSLTVS